MCKHKLATVVTSDDKRTFGIPVNNQVLVFTRNGAKKDGADTDVKIKVGRKPVTVTVINDKDIVYVIVPETGEIFWKKVERVNGVCTVIPVYKFQEDRSFVLTAVQVGKQKVMEWVEDGVKISNQFTRSFGEAKKRLFELQKSTKVEVISSSMGSLESVAA